MSGRNDVAASTLLDHEASPTDVNSNASLRERSASPADVSIVFDCASSGQLKTIYSGYIILFYSGIQCMVIVLEKSLDRGNNLNSYNEHLEGTISNEWCHG